MLMRGTVFWNSKYLVPGHNPFPSIFSVLFPNRFFLLSLLHMKLLLITFFLSTLVLTTLALSTRFLSAADHSNGDVGGVDENIRPQSVDMQSIQQLRVCFYVRRKSCYHFIANLVRPQNAVSRKQGKLRKEEIARRVTKLRKEKSWMKNFLIKSIMIYKCRWACSIRRSE